MAETKKKQASPTLEEPQNQGEAFLLKYKNALICCVVVLILIVCGSIWYSDYQSGKQDEASTAMAKAQDHFQNGNFELALNGDSLSTAGFLKIANDYSSTKAGNLASLYAGLCYANMEKWEEAAQYLAQFNSEDDQMISPAALGALGNAYAHLNQLDKAVSTLISAAEKADNNSISPTFLIQAGQILESQGKKAEALKLYKQVKEKYFDSMQTQYQTIDEYIERVSE
jgi:predicted negative regulator of RcsB-dependent stress response